MTFNQQTRKELYQKFLDSHQPGKMFNLLHGADSKEAFGVFTTMQYNFTEEQKKLFDKMNKAICAYKGTPGKFFRTNYGKVVEFCVGSKNEAEILYKYFDKLNRFSYSTNWDRRTVRTKTYINPVLKIKHILYAAYHLQFYNCSLDKYLLNQMSEELLDYKNNYRISMPGLEGIIAAHLDAGDQAVKNALLQIITGENNIAFLNTSMIRGIFKSNDRELHKLLGQLLVAARLQEGVRQSICENMDCGTIEAFRTLFHVIEDNELLRYSAVRRAVATWIGVLDPEHLTRSSNKTFNLMREVVDDKNKAYELVENDDAMQILVGLWGIGFYEVNDALRVMENIIDSGTTQQKRVATFYNHCLEDRDVQQKFANKVIESEGLDIELAAGIFDTYLSDYHRETIQACNVQGDKQNQIRPVNFKLWFDDRETSRKHMHILLNLLGEMKQKKYQFNPYVFPWYFTNITASNVLVRICLIANGLEDDEMMDKLAEKIPEMDSADNSRLTAVRLLLSGNLSPRRKEILIQTLGDKESYTRKEAFGIAKRTQFTPEEYDKMCELLRFKAADLRLNIISLLKEQDAKGIERSLKVLLKDKREELRLAGLDILQGLIKEEDKSVKLIEIGKKLVAEMEKPTEREKIFLNEIFGEASEQNDDDSEHMLFTEEDTISLPVHHCNSSDYPIFKITESRLDDLFTKLDRLIYEYRNYEVKTAYGEKVLLGNQNHLPVMKYAGTFDERYPLMDVWKTFYEKEIGCPEDLMAMILALAPCSVTVGYGRNEVTDKVYAQYINKLANNIFGEAVVKFHPSAYQYGRVAARGVSQSVVGGDLFRDILKTLVDTYCDIDFQHTLGRKVAEYLCTHVAEDKRILLTELGSGPSNRKTCVTPLNAQIFTVAMNGFADKWNTKEQFETRFILFLVLGQKFMKIPENCTQWALHTIGNLKLKAVDYVVAAYYGIITEAQMYYAIFKAPALRESLQNLFIIYRAEKYPALKQQIQKYGILENEELEKYVCSVAHQVAEQIVKVECKRGDSLTEYSNAVTAIEFFYGTNHLVKLLTALGKDKFVRCDGFGWNSNGSRKVNLCHLVSVCHPLPEETVESFAKALEGTSINEKRLIEVAMYAPQWIDLIEPYLNFTGLKSGAYYFMAHMNDQYNRDQRKFATIARFTPLEKEELFNGAFDISWFEEAYEILGEKKFQMLYDAAKYTSDGSKHSRARKYADATLGKVGLAELETEISEKRNKDLLMSYPLVPLQGKEDMLHRYEFIQKFRKESLQFGSQRRSSEGIACDMAMRNLATRAGFKDVTRLTLVMEVALAESLSHYFEWTTLEQGKDVVETRIQVSEAGKPEVLVRKGEKMLASIPAAFKKHPYILELKESNKKFKEQYSRTVKMFELSMEEREYYSMEEIVSLLANPAIRPIVENLVFIHDETGEISTVEEYLGAEGMKLIRVAHPFDLYKSGEWTKWQKTFLARQQETGMKQPFRQVFRELYVKLDEELQQKYSRMFAGHQIQPTKTVAVLKGRRWIADHETGLEKVFYKDNIAVTMYALADWFSPSDIEPPTLEYVSFSDRKTFKALSIEEIPDIVYSEAMRDVDLAVSVAHAGNVDPEASHSTIEMRKVIVECNIDLFGLKNVSVEGTHAFITGKLGEYTVHLGSGVVHMVGVHQINILPVHSQHRGKIFLPFLDEDPKTAEIVSKILLFAEDIKIKDPYILEQMR